MARTTIPERLFDTLDPARMPESPISPNRTLINLVGALAGLGLGFGLVALQQYRDNALRSEDDVWEVRKVPVRAAIPLIVTSGDLRRQKRRRLYGILGASAAFVVVAGSALLVWAIGVQRLTQWFR